MHGATPPNERLSYGFLFSDLKGFLMSKRKARPTAAANAQNAKDIQLLAAAVLKLNEQIPDEEDSLGWIKAEDVVALVNGPVPRDCLHTNVPAADALVPLLVLRGLPPLVISPTSAALLRKRLERSS